MVVVSDRPQFIKPKNEKKSILDQTAVVSGLFSDYDFDYYDDTNPKKKSKEERKELT